MSSPRIALLAALLLILPWCSLITNDTSPESPTTGMMISGDVSSWMTQTSIVSSWADSQTWVVTPSTWSADTSTQIQQSIQPITLIKQERVNASGITVVDVTVNPYDIMFTLDPIGHYGDSGWERPTEGDKVEQLQNCKKNTIASWNMISISLYGEDSFLFNESPWIIGEWMIILPLAWRSLEQAIKEDFLAQHPSCSSDWDLKSRTLALPKNMQQRLDDTRSDMWNDTSWIEEYCPLKYFNSGWKEFRQINDKYYAFLHHNRQDIICWERENTLK